MFTVDEDFGEDTVTPGPPPASSSSTGSPLSSWKAEGPPCRSRRQPRPSCLALLPAMAFQRRRQSDLERKDEALLKEWGRLYKHILSLNWPGMTVYWGPACLSSMGDNLRAPGRLAHDSFGCLARSTIFTQGEKSHLGNWVHRVVVEHMSI